MKIAGNHVLASPRAEVWPLISDPASLARLIPGCERLEEMAPGEFRGRIHIPVPAVAGAYDTFVRVEDVGEPFVTRFDGEIAGPAGAMRGSALFRLAEDAAGCVLSYEGDALITGPLSRMDGRFTESVTRAMISQGLSTLDAQLQERAGAHEQVSGTPLSPEAAPPTSLRSWLDRLIAWIRTLFGPP